MRRTRRIKHQRKNKDDLLLYSFNDVKTMIMSFLEFRLTPEKKGFGQIIYNNSVPVLDKWLNENKKK